MHKWADETKSHVLYQALWLLSGHIVWVLHQATLFSPDMQGARVEKFVPTRGMMLSVFEEMDAMGQGKLMVGSLEQVSWLVSALGEIHVAPA